MSSIGNVNNSVSINDKKTFYLGEKNVEEIIKVLDKNDTGFIENDEISVPNNLRGKIDSNNDGKLSVVEFIGALESQKISINNLSKDQADKIAEGLIKDKVKTEAFGELGKVLDINKSGFITKEELSNALQEGKVIINGSYLVENKSPPDSISTLDDVKKHINLIRSQIKTSPFDTNGIYTHKEANKLIHDYIKNKVINSNDLTLKDKMSIIKSEIMSINSFGQQLENTGSLTNANAKNLVTQLLSLPIDQHSFNSDSAKDFVDTIKSLTMKTNGFLMEDPRTGIFTRNEAANMMKNFINNSLMKAENISDTIKVDIIKESIRTNQNLNGVLSNNEAKNLIKTIITTPIPSEKLNGETAKERIRIATDLLAKQDSPNTNNPFEFLITMNSFLFTPKEINNIIKPFVLNQVVPSDSVPLKDKIDILSKEKIDNGREKTGCLSENEYKSLVKKVFNEIPNKNNLLANDIKEYINIVRSQIMKQVNMFQSIGALTRTEASNLIKNFINNTLIDTPLISKQEKIDIIKSVTMQRNSFGYDPLSGELTPDEANKLIKRILESK